MEGKYFRKAVRLYKRKKYSKVIQLLEPQVFRFRESFTFFHLLGMSCLQVGDIGGAYSYLNRAHDLNPRDINTLLGLAVIYLKKQDTQKALSTWFSVLDIDNDNKTAQRGLKLLKKYADSDNLQELFDSAKLSKIMPSVSFKTFSLKGAAIAAAVIIMAAGAIYMAVSGGIPPRDRTPDREGSASLKIKAVVKNNDESSYTIIFTEKELKKELDKIRKLFNKFDDNRTMYEINKVLLSNADQKVKNQVLILKGYLTEPTFSSIDTNFSYEEVIKNPLLYEDCFVVWKGRISNLSISEKQITFDLLVGYESGKILKGIVPVKLDFAVKIDTALPIEVLGRVVLSEDGMYLQGKSIHQFQETE